PTATTTYTALKNASGQLNFAGNVSGGNTNTVLLLTSDTSGDNTTTFRFAGTNTERATLNLSRGGIIAASAAAFGNPANLVFLNSSNNPTLGDLRFEVGGSFPNPIQFQSATGVNTNGNVVTLSGPLSGAAAWNVFGTSGSALVLTGTGDTNSGAIT